MQTVYLKKYNNIEDSFIQKIKSWYRRTFNILKIRSIDNIIICEIPSLNKPKEKEMIRIGKKVCKTLFNRFRIK